MKGHIRQGKRRLDKAGDVKNKIEQYNRRE